VIAICQFTCVSLVVQLGRETRFSVHIGWQGSRNGSSQPEYRTPFASVNANPRNNMCLSCKEFDLSRHHAKLFWSMSQLDFEECWNRIITALQKREGGRSASIRKK
jgi:hypothetical protein